MSSFIDFFFWTVTCICSHSIYKMYFYKITSLLSPKCCLDHRSCYEILSIYMLFMMSIMMRFLISSFKCSMEESNLLDMLCHKIPHFAVSTQCFALEVFSSEWIIFQLSIFQFHCLYLYHFLPIMIDHSCIMLVHEMNLNRETWSI